MCKGIHHTSSYLKKKNYKKRIWVHLVFGGPLSCIFPFKQVYGYKEEFMFFFEIFFCKYYYFCQCKKI